MSARLATATWSAPGERLRLLIAALGGQGGGVLTEWIVHAARGEGRTVQATSTPGVSQRTGGTTYYVEIASGVGALPPALALTPLPGRVDVLVCAELLETARMLERGMSTPTRTTIIASTHRIYTTREKNACWTMVGSTAIGSSTPYTHWHAMRFCSTWRASVPSTARPSALSFSGRLPGAASCLWDASPARRQSWRQGKASGRALPRSPTATHALQRSDGSTAGVGIANSVSPPADASVPHILSRRIATLPPAIADIARAGAARALDFQNIAYARRYLDRVDRIARAEINAGARDTGHPVAREAARHLALWMCYDDVIRVAALKARGSRLDRIRREARADERDIVRVFDCLRPSATEIAAVLPEAMGLARASHGCCRRGATTYAAGQLRVRRPAAQAYGGFAAASATFAALCPGARGDRCWLTAIERTLTMGTTPARMQHTRSRGCRATSRDTERRMPRQRRFPAHARAVHRGKQRRFGRKRGDLARNGGSQGRRSGAHEARPAVSD